MKACSSLVIALFFFFSIYGQCPDRNFLYHRIIYLRDSSSVTPEKQIEELLNYKKHCEQCNAVNDSAYALLLQRAGWLYTTKSDFDKAIQFTKESIALVSLPKNISVNPALAIKSYWNLCLMYDSLKLEERKLASADSCISLAIRLNTGEPYALGAIKSSVPILFNTGDYFRCINYSKLGQSILNKTGSNADDIEETSFIFFTWQVNALTFLNKTEEAEKLLIDKIHLAENSHKIKFLGTLYGLYATALAQRSMSKEAINYYLKSFDCNKKIGYKEGCAEALNNIGFVYANDPLQKEMALQYFFRAINFANTNEVFNIMDNIANIYVKAGKYDVAFSYFQKAFDLIRPGFTEKDLLKNNREIDNQITEYITGLVLDKASAWLEKYKVTGEHKALEEAINIYELADHYFDKLKSAQSEIQSRLFWKTNNHRLYRNAVDACYLADDVEKAFYFFEKSRSGLLNDQINEQKKMDDNKLAKQAQLKKNILEIERKLQTSSSSSKDNLILQQKLFINKQEEELLMEKNSSHQTYVKNYYDTTTINLSIIKKKILNDKRLMLEIFTADSVVYILTATESNSSLVKLDKHLYDSLASAYISFLIDHEKTNRAFGDFMSISHQLYKLIFEKADLQNKQNLIISPDEKGFPFEAFIINNDKKNPDYLLNHYAVSYTYSARYLINEYALNTNTTSTVLGVAPVKYNSSLSLAELQGSDISLQKIKNQFSGTTNFIFGNATRDNFMANFPTYSIIQLYTHAADSSANNDPVIYFADSALYLSDLIPQQRPVTQLVVLSACETAKGKLYQGEGIFSFNRGFAALGIPAAVSNLWSVENESTYRITELFYKYLSKGVPTDVALQKAKLEFISISSSQEKKLPYYWAGCILTGKVDTIKTNQSFSWMKITGISILIMTSTFLLFRIYYKNNKPLSS